MVRQSLVIAILKITDPPDNVEFHQTCPAGIVQNATSFDHSGTSGNLSESGNNWTASQYANMFAAFYYGYLFGMFPSSVLSQYIGFFPTLTFSGFMNGILTIIYPLAIGYSYNMGNI